MAKKVSVSYFEEHGKVLRKIVDDYRGYQTELFSTSTFSVFNTLEQGVTNHPLRYYQKDALYILDHLFSTAERELYSKLHIPGHRGKDIIKGLLEEVDSETNKEAPFIGYEMATGSGKTMLMGASIYLLNQKYGIKNFLIITPPSTDIYQKTIRNFMVGNFESVWSDDTPFRFNVITGDNYTQNLFYDESKDANIFIFNISKFGKNAKNTTKTWESAIWRDEQGNNISIKQYLKDKKLVIITDEAHHAQNRASKQIIMNFHPNAVLEFTATAVESDSNQEKRNQTIVYKYDIRRLLEDGHGKLVRAVALDTESKQKQKSEIPQAEKLKIITLFLIHILKKKAVLLDQKARGLKPIAFIKVKEDTAYTQKVFDYIKDNLADDVENINIIFEKVKQQDLNITNLLQELLINDFKNDPNKVRAEIQSIARTTIFYHGKSDKETEKKFRDIRTNDVEIVVYMQRLDEGIDLPNIYSMAVISDTASGFKTSVKQIIGRGVRLNKDMREFDEDENPILQQAEMLHIVCDQGKNFEEQIIAIQREFGLSNKYISYDKEKQTVANHSKSELLEKRFIPHIKADFRVKEGANLISLINDADTIVNRFIEDNCFAGPQDDIKRFIKYRPDSFFIEVDVFADKNVYHKQLQQTGGVITPLTLGSKELKSIYGIVLKTLHCLPDSDTTKKTFQAYIDKFNNIGLQYYRLSDADDRLAVNLLVNSFSFFYKNHIEKNYFAIEFREIRSEDTYNLRNSFKDYEMKIPVDQVENTSWRKIKDRGKMVDLVSSGYSFFGYEKSVYDYNSFDSYTEKQLADYINDVLKNVPADKRPFWVRNQRQVYFTYGSKKYYPDFIMVKDDITYVIETKGEVFSDTKKNILLKKLDEIPGYKGLLVFSQQADLLDGESWDFEKFVGYSEEFLKRRQSRHDLLPDAPIEEQFIRYVPVYSPANAHKKFVKKNKSPKSDGWLECPEIPGGYPRTIIATQVKGTCLDNRYKENDWILLNTIIDADNARGKICLVHSKEIRDSYEDHFTMRQLEVTTKTLPGKLWPEAVIHLKSLDNDIEDIVLENVDSDSSFAIIGVEYLPAGN
ncbi:MAG: DEAD/DEAH box helicase family protein [Nitrospirae bacterium]|nr:DEAD/DEAH box helicase family protein [Nitrospirota bacterium]